MPEPIATFAEMRRMLAVLPGPDVAARDAALARERLLTKPTGSLGRLEPVAAWLAAWQGRHPPDVRRPRTAVFAANHGVARHGVSAYPAAVTAEMVRNFAAGGAAVNQLCTTVDADLRVYELDLDHPTADMTEGPAMTEEACARAMAYGMMAVEPGIDLLAVGEMGIANTTAAAALSLALFGGAAADWVGPGTGVAGTALAAKKAAVERAVAVNRAAMADPFAVLRCVGGFELAAIVGAVMAARLARTPVLLDGYASTAAASVLFALDPGALDHCLVGHRSTEPGHGRLLTRLGQEPLLDLGMRLGEGSGATLAIAVVRAAAACHAGMATFAEAGVSGRT
ncbi:MAG: nicotinate-nucleotide--dimethylbenzimidazole phosphoribosyltransferase [Alphaproteobacteria bacterium]|nr:nicotinate-nucleotide--dimethylbenzimidazole phosphoribosyltransferase [Alphaproteobacteria bacterium]